MLKDPAIRCIYLDHHATTPLDTRVFARMEPFFFGHFGNPASKTHPYGWRAQDAVDQARIELAAAINAHPSEIIFTSGATESTNMALKGLFWPKATVEGRSILTSSIEHGATHATILALQAFGIEACMIKPNVGGCVTPELLASHLGPHIAVVSLFMVNNEIGSINDIKALSHEAKKHGALFHTDAAQALGRIPIDCQELGIDMMSLSGHKIYGPKGIGALYVRRELMPRLCPLIHGGGQEWQKRSGTLNVPGVVGLGEAARLASLALGEETNNIRALRDKLWRELQALGDVHVNGAMKERIAGNLNISFGGIDGEELLLSICHRVALSAGSACASGSRSHSRVLSELGLGGELRQATLRIGVGRSNTEAEIDEAAHLIAMEVKRQRGKKGFIAPRISKK